MLTDLQKALPPSYLERGLDGLIPILKAAEEKPLMAMVSEFVAALERGEQVNIHESCCGVGVAAEQLQLLLNALCIVHGVRARASVVGSDINPLHQERLHPNLEVYHHLAWAYLASQRPDIDVHALLKIPELQKPQARIISAPAQEAIEHRGPLDLAFCIQGIPYVDDKLTAIYNTIEALRENSGLAVWNAFDLDSVHITHIQHGAWQGRYKTKNFLEDLRPHNLRLHLDLKANTYTLAARRRGAALGPRPRFIGAHEQSLTADALSTSPWNHHKFRRRSEYEFEE